jgi:hypothetical protein
MTSKAEAPKSKNQIPKNNQASNRNDQKRMNAPTLPINLRPLNFDDWSFSGAWSLEFGAFGRDRLLQKIA